MSRIATSIAAEVNLSPGTARRVLLAHVRALQNSHAAPTAARHDGGNVMTIVLIIAAAGVLLTGVKWAFLPFIPYRRLPRHRVRYLRLRLRLRLHPGAGPRHRRRSCGCAGAGLPCSAAAAGPAGR